ncbi:small conductance mechanosensitive channel [Tistlia consotensis]|uniref:Small-conductance mechanosensitive channel n=1 Tax=Tistlia consotensis USBA 355 TaxID=560819 RepID=A0A1Y6CI34_9PROT|nr:mechanosensitive ion channel domain-containing protein [Tistlia consotensis]SMF67008.1 small conductance mechanosensitive channel [Tistlia consotensis USBA 355]SNS00591.1 small conductance mechanosensitive channel [Tistlia consotensis]
MKEQIDLAYAQVMAVIATYGLSVLAAIGILVVGLILAGWAGRSTERALGRIRHVDATLRGFIGSLVKYVVLAVTILAVLSQFGVQTASLLAIFGAVGLAVGLALQGTLSNLAAGVMLMMFRPFRAGDYIVSGSLSGTVKNITLFTTELATPDNVQVIAPNNDLWGTPITNYSVYTTRRLDLTVGIGYGDDIGKARDTLTALMQADGRVHADPAPQVLVANLGDSAVELILRLWCDAGDYWAVKWDLTRGIKESLDAAGIEIPFPQRTVHTVAPAAAAE